jgi:hypothetical protein
MFRFFNAGRTAPQTAFAHGARSAMYMGVWMTRRHCARAHTPFVTGFIDSRLVLGDCAIRAHMPFGSVLCAAELAIAGAGDSLADMATMMRLGELASAPLEIMSLAGHTTLLATFGRCYFCIRMLWSLSGA